MAAYGTMDSAILGLPYGLAQDFEFESYPAAAAITPGRPVYQTPGTVTSVHQTYVVGDVFMGVALANQMSHIDDVGTYATYDVVNVLKKGKVWMQVSKAFTATAPVAAYATAAGLVSPTASGNYNIGAMIRTNQATVSGLAVVEINGIKLVA
jgi:hypothetical protein